MRSILRAFSGHVLYADGRGGVQKVGEAILAVSAIWLSEVGQHSGNVPGVQA